MRSRKAAKSLVHEFEEERPRAALGPNNPGSWSAFKPVTYKNGGQRLLQDPRNVNILAPQILQKATCQ
jgi:hypothetical protein